MLVGLIDAGFLYQEMADRVHPLGIINKNIKYKVNRRFLFKRFTCNFFICNLFLGKKIKAKLKILNLGSLFSLKIEQG